MQKYLNYVTNQAGTILTGVTVTVYLSGTSTLATIYSDNGVTAQANPFTNNNTDASVTFYAANGVYDLVFTKPGVTFSATETAGVRLFDPQNLIVSVKDATYYAKGDGVTNDTAAFTSAGSGSGVVQVWVPVGTYLLSTSPTPTGDVTWVFAAGATTTGAGVLPGKIVKLGSTQGALSILNQKITANILGEVPGMKVGIAAGTEAGWTSNPSTSNWVTLYSYISSSAVRNKVWAANTIVDVISGSPATAWSIEADMNVGTSNAPDPRNTNHALGVDVVSGGNFAPSAAFLTNATTLANRWKHGIWFDYVGGQSGSTLVKVNTNVSVDFGLDLSLATVNFQGVRVGTTNAGQIAPIALRQFANNQVGLFLQRFTDTAPTGNLLQAVNAANNVIIASIDALGNLTCQNIVAPLINNGVSTLSIGGASTDVQWVRPLVALGGGVAPTLGTIGGSGPATAAQNTWVRFLDSAGVPFWVPAWK